MKISVIIPVYNVEPYLTRCIDSVIRQTLPDFELILTDDGSPDACGELCDEYAVSDERLVVIHQQNGGLSCARNTGIEWSFACSNSEWINFIDSDDWVDEHYLACLYAASHSTNIAMCGFQRTNGMDYHEDSIVPYSLKTAEEIWMLKRTNTTVAVGKLYKKSLWDNIRFPLNKIHEDVFTIYKLIFACNTIAVIDSALYYYYQNSAGIMGSAWSPKRLDAVEALLQITEFFLSEGNMRLYLDGLQDYMNILADNTIHAKADVQYRAIHRELKKKLRSEIKKYKKILNLTMGNNVIYVAAYPKITYWYCVLKAAKKRIKNLCNNSGI